MALAGAGITGNNHPLFASDKVKLGEFQDLYSVDTFLEIKIKIGQQFSLREPRFLDSTFDSPLDEAIRLRSQQSFKQLGRRRG